jgi:hypothetical protein
MALNKCLLADLEPADGTSDIAASGEGYDETLHSSMQTFWEMFGLGQITQKCYVHNMQQHYYKGITIQQTPVAISRFTS